MRERWLNPPEWTVEKILEFPGSVNGPWSRYIVPGSARASRAAADAPSAAAGKIPTGASESTRGGACAPPTNQIGTVRYPRLEPRDADCAAQLKDRTLTKLYNERPAWLDFAHKKLDAAVAAAYGFPAGLTDAAILEKLLALNLERAAGEAKAAKEKKSKTSREKRADEMI